MSAIVRDMRARRPDASTEQPARSEHVELRIGGMNCAHCPPAIEKAAAAVPGVTSASVNSSTKVARIDYDPARAKIPDILHAIRSVGYTVGTATMRVPIKNMHCGSCLIRIELALQMVPGVVSARASLGTNAADIEYQPEKVDFPTIHKAIESAGYHVAEPKIDPNAEVLDPAEAANEQEYRTLMRKFWFAAVISIPVMALSYPDLVPGLRDWMPMGKRHAPDCLESLGRFEPARDVLGGFAILHRNVGCPQTSRSQYAHADLDRNQRRLCLFGRHRGVAANLPAHGARGSVLGRDRRRGCTGGSRPSA